MNRVLITGAGRGIGAACALAFAGAGARLALADLAVPEATAQKARDAGAADVLSLA
ncbi:MAG: SDR family NAD(P)-dependent oxidoreductase, partial [Paracoccaceae bacterium]